MSPHRLHLSGGPFSARRLSTSVVTTSVRLQIASRQRRQHFQQRASPVKARKQSNSDCRTEQRNAVICSALCVVVHLVIASWSRVSSYRFQPSGGQSFRMANQLSTPCWFEVASRQRRHFQQRASPPRPRACLKSDTQSSASVSSPSPWGGEVRAD